MSALENSHWPFVSTDKPPLFFNARRSGLTAPQWSEPWTYSDAQSRKRRRSEVEEVPADNQRATRTAHASDPTQQQPARKVRIAPAYRASRGQERFRLSDVGEYVKAWAARIFSGWMAPYPVVCETNDDVQGPKPASQRGQHHEHPTRTSRKKPDSAWAAVLQDMNGEVAAFKDRKDEWRQSPQNYPRDRSTQDGDVELMDVDDEMEHLAEEVLLLRHRYNFLADSALNQHPGIGIIFFTEEELNRSDLLSLRKKRPYQATVRDEDEESVFEASTIPASYPLFPPSRVSAATHDTAPESGNASAVEFIFRYGLIHFPAKFGQTVTHESSESSSEGDDTASEERIDPGLESNDSASIHGGTEHDVSDPALSLQYPELPASPPALYTIPAHLIPEKVTGTHRRPIENVGLSAPTKTPTGTADSFDQQRALLNKSNIKQRPSSTATQKATSEEPSSSTGKHASSNQAELSSREVVSTSRPVKKIPKASAPPVIPEITTEPPSNSTRSSSSGSIDLEKLLPPRPAQTRTQRNASRGGHRPKNLSASTTTIRPTKPRLSLSGTRTDDASQTTQRFQKPSSTIMPGRPSKLSSTISNKLPNAAKPAQNSRNTSFSTEPSAAAKASLSTSSTTVRNAPRTAQLTKPAIKSNSTVSTKPPSSILSNGIDDTLKLSQKLHHGSSLPKPASSSGLLGLENSILGKKETTAGQSDPSQTKPASHGNQLYTLQGSGDGENDSKGSHNADDAVICPECTFSNPPNARTCKICKAKFVDMSANSNTSDLHIPGAFPGSTEGTGDFQMQDNEPAFTPVTDGSIVLYKTRASLSPTDPDHYATGGAGPRGTFDLLGNLTPISEYEASRLAGQRESASRGPRGAPYFNERNQLTKEESVKYADIKAWEKRKRLRLHGLEQMKWEKLSDKEKQAVLQRQEQKRQIFLQVQTAADAQARLGNEVFKMLGYG